MAVLISNAAQILTMCNNFTLISEGSILIEGETIRELGSISKKGKKIDIIDAQGCVVTPGLVDSHTHLVFAGSREEEFSARIAGVRYETITKKGGGIMTTVRHTRNATEEELYNSAMSRIKNLIKHGTTTVEVKSGYGLTTDGELKILRVIKRLQETSPIDVIPTLLIHTIPPRIKRRDYIDQINSELIPQVASEKLAQFCDIFCDSIAFSVRESHKVLKKARDLGLKLKIHADELSNSGGAALAAEVGCTSADHLIYTTKLEIEKMKKANVVPVLLPGTSLFLRTRKKPDVRCFIKMELPIAIASDFNPGTCPIYAMPKIISLASLLYGIPVERALVGATANAARALDLYPKVGCIQPGAQADLVVWAVDNYKKISYQFGEDIIKLVLKRGKIIYDTNC